MDGWVQHVSVSLVLFRRTQLIFPLLCKHNILETSSVFSIESRKTGGAPICIFWATASKCTNDLLTLVMAFHVIIIYSVSSRFRFRHNLSFVSCWRVLFLEKKKKKSLKTPQSDTKSTCADVRWLRKKDKNKTEKTNWDSAGESRALFTAAAQSEPVGTTLLTPPVSDARSHPSRWSEGNL